MDVSIGPLLVTSMPARLIALRKEHNLSQQEVAASIGVSINRIKKFENGRAEPSLKLLKKLALTLRVSTDFLLFGKELGKESGKGFGNERQLSPCNELKHHFEAMSEFDEEELRIANALLEILVFKYKTKALWHRSLAPGVD